ncbi:glycosyl hydrolase catalytic core-domain-containing protein [Trametes elegans]|nr:glycosyl hydrolase catalytic core-domain-containing protein [Trametes elegans]
MIAKFLKIAIPSLLAAACTVGAAPGTVASNLTLPRSADATQSGFGQKGSKVCIAWSEGNDASLSHFKTSHVSGLYTWGTNKPTSANALGFDFWPMLWSGSQDSINAFESSVKAGFGTIILGFNEPNEQGQANLDPNTAAALWKQHIVPKKALGYKTCSPAVSAAPSGQQWMQQFMQACGGACQIDYMCVHWYGVGFTYLQTYLENWHNQYGLPLLLTEFAEVNYGSGAQPSLSDVTAFTKQTLQFVDNTSWMLAACPFGIQRTPFSPNPNIALQNSDGTPTQLGSIVINDQY